ncbi:3' terminal RNA ribose 2'-O-methyltransferase Hen1 [Ferrimicrobium sp.]|uniref:3' terminal RNA ribose 2'-O-methyltransferase Hen1 n=1 Tax=Ferrimicrobium sp. TaxID=2926050 RepID=UPI0026313F8F|nr:3' terminal RNA ribose 2'-O-methyltransferase Hen1 [Ferrimicrobium sp.]
MLLTITTTTSPATDLGFLLHKNPDSHYTVSLSFGTVHVVYPEAKHDRCTAALLVDIDPIALVRARQGSSGADLALSQYINDRPYSTSSLLSVALITAFSTAMGGRCKERPELVNRPLSLEVKMPVVSCPQGEQLVRKLFEPLGYEVEIHPVALDERFPGWGESSLFALTLRGEAVLQHLLSHLYVLLPVLDDEKHYWVGQEEVDKLLRQGQEWLPTHPERDLIARRYLRYHHDLVEQALSRLFDEESGFPLSTEVDKGHEPLASTQGLGASRREAVREALRSHGARRIVDLGCGEGRLIGELLSEQGIERVVGMDVAHRALKKASAHLHLETMTPRERGRVELLHGSVTYCDSRLVGFDAAVAVEVIEHLDPTKLGAFESNVFGFARPTTVVVTTPNSDYNSLFPLLGEGEFRHPDHRFEWNRQEFDRWCRAVADKYGYSVVISGIGDEDEEHGAPSQMAVFSR